MKIVTVYSVSNSFYLCPELFVFKALKAFFAALLRPVRLNLLDMEDLLAVGASTVRHANMGENVGILPMGRLISVLSIEFPGLLMDPSRVSR